MVSVGGCVDGGEKWGCDVDVVGLTHNRTHRVLERNANEKNDDGNRNEMFTPIQPAVVVD